MTGSQYFLSSQPKRSIYYTNNIDSRSSALIEVRCTSKGKAIKLAISKGRKRTTYLPQYLKSFIILLPSAYLGSRSANYCPKVLLNFQEKFGRKQFQNNFLKCFEWMEDPWACMTLVPMLLNFFSPEFADDKVDKTQIVPDVAHDQKKQMSWP